MPEAMEKPHDRPWSRVRGNHAYLERRGKILIEGGETNCWKSYIIKIPMFCSDFCGMPYQEKGHYAELNGVIGVLALFFKRLLGERFFLKPNVPHP
jgi:hypothetical protein